VILYSVHCYALHWADKNHFSYLCMGICIRIILGSDRRPETKQGIGVKIVRFRSGRIRDRVRVRDKDRRPEPDRRSKAINFGAC